MYLNYYVAGDDLSSDNFLQLSHKKSYQNIELEQKILRMSKHRFSLLSILNEVKEAIPDLGYTADSLWTDFEYSKLLFANFAMYEFEFKVDHIFSIISAYTKEMDALDKRKSRQSYDRSINIFENIGLNYRFINSKDIYSLVLIGIKTSIVSLAMIMIRLNIISFLLLLNRINMTSV